MKLIFKQRGLCEYVMVPLDTSWRTAYAHTTRRAKRHWVASKLAMILPFDDTTVHSGKNFQNFGQA